MTTIVFDLDGTLVDTAPDLCSSLNHCLTHAGLPPIGLDAVRPHAGHGARVMLEHAYASAGRPLGEDEVEDQLDRFIAYYKAHIADASRPFPGMVAALDQLEAAGFTLAVCTNKRERLSQLLLQTLGLADRFRAICGADTFLRKKPDPMHLLGTIERAGGKPDRAVMVGDTATDTDAALAAKVPSILVDFGYAPDERARRAAAAVIERYEDLDAALCERLLVEAGA